MKDHKKAECFKENHFSICNFAGSWGLERFISSYCEGSAAVPDQIANRFSEAASKFLKTFIA
jgi:hypothetical protein